MGGSESNRLTLSPRGRGWPAADAFTSRGGPGEGVGNMLPNYETTCLGNKRL
jgi:hypothetical protein